MAKSTIFGAFVQTNPKFGQNEENIERAIEIASKVRSDIYVFPELCNTGYAFKSKRECLALAESLKNGNSVEQFKAFTEKNKCSVVVGLAERDDDNVAKAYNSSIVIERGEIVGTYRKMHLFYREKLWFSRSNSGFKPLSLNSIGCKIGVLICFDWLFPESSRTLALAGAEVLCHPSDLVLPGKGQLGMMVRAFENRVFAITANRVGFENRGPKDTFRFTGQSQIISPEMKKLASAGENNVTCKSAKIDLELARRKMVTPLNDVIKDRRPSFYRF